MSKWLFLGLAIFSEVVATASLKSTEGFTRWGPSLIVIVGYCSAFYFLSLTLDTIPVGVAYAIWSGVGVTNHHRVVLLVRSETRWLGLLVSA